MLVLYYQILAREARAEVELAPKEHGKWTGLTISAKDTIKLLIACNPDKHSNFLKLSGFDLGKKVKELCTHLGCAHHFLAHQRPV